MKTPLADQDTASEVTDWADRLHSAVDELCGDLDGTCLFDQLLDAVKITPDTWVERAREDALTIVTLAASNLLAYATGEENPDPLDTVLTLVNLESFTNYEVRAGSINVMTLTSRVLQLEMFVSVARTWVWYPRPNERS